MALMGIDIGTMGCKCSVFDNKGQPLSFGYKGYDIVSPQAGYQELDADEVWNAVKFAIVQSMSSCKKEPLMALSLSSFGEATVFLDCDGNVLYNSLLCTDIRGEEYANFLTQKLGSEKISLITGLPIHPMYSICKILWMKEHEATIYNKTWKILLFEDYIMYRLTGETCIDYTLASRTMAFNIVKKSWSNEILDMAGVDKRLFATPVPSGKIVGNIKKSIADELGLTEDVLVVAGAHDQMCASLGAGIAKPNMAVDGMGTSECITTVFNRPILDPQLFKSNYHCGPYVIDDMYATFAYTFSGGALVQWFKNTFCAKEVFEAQRTGKDIYQILDSKAADTPTSILVFPHFRGSGTPSLNPNAKGSIVGMDFHDTFAEVYRAVLEGISYEMRYNLECFENIGIKSEILYAVGGGAKSDLWLQIKADILGKKIIRLNVSEAGTLGAAILAGTACGVFTSIQSAIENVSVVGKEFLPNPANREKYNENFSKYKNLYQVMLK